MYHVEACKKKLGVKKILYISYMFVVTIFTVVNIRYIIRHYYFTYIERVKFRQLNTKALATNLMGNAYKLIHIYIVNSLWQVNSTKTHSYNVLSFNNNWLWKRLNKKVWGNCVHDHLLSFEHTICAFHPLAYL